MSTNLIKHAAWIGLLALAAASGAHAQATPPSKEYIYLGGRVIAIENAVTLSITTTSLPNGIVNQTYPQTTLIATGGGQSDTYTWAVSSTSPNQMPAGLSLSSAGVISGTPTAVGTTSVVITVTDTSVSSHPTASHEYSIMIGAFTIVSPTLPATAVGSQYSVQFAATNGTLPYTWAVSAGALPSGLALSTSGLLTTQAGTPISGSGGTYSFTVQATDHAAQTATLALSLNVLGIVVPTLPIARLNVSYTATQLTATGGTGNYTWTLVTGSSLPSGLSLSTAGVLSGTVSSSVTPATYPFLAQVTDTSTSVTASAQISITVQSSALVITSNTTLPAGTAGSQYAGATLQAQGGTPPYTWTLIGTADGLVLSSAGVLSGTPTSSGTFSVQVQVSDSASSTPATATFSLTVATGAASLAITTSGLPGGTTEVSYTTTLAATGGTPPYTWSATGLPDGLSLSTAGTLSGTPTTAGSYTATIYVRDTVTWVSKSLTIAISQGLSLSSSTRVVVGGQTATLTASQSVTWSLSGVGSLSTAGPSTQVFYTAPNSITTSQYVTVTAAASGSTISLVLLAVPPQVTLTPSGNATTYTPGKPVSFTLSGPLSDNWTSLNDYLILNISPTPTENWDASCMLQYQATTSTFFLYDDNGTTWQSGARGSQTVLSNSQCSADLSSATAQLFGAVLTVTVNVTFMPSYVGIKNLWMEAYGGADAWEWFGAIYSFGISPASSTLSINQSQQFAAKDWYDRDATYNWSLNPLIGTLSVSGATATYTAPASISSPQTITISSTTPSTSLTATAAVTLQPPSTVSTPVFSPSPGGGPYSSGLVVTLTATPADATIQYTIDGSTPTETNGNVYTGGLNLSSTTTVKAIAYKLGWTDSAVATSTYTITPGSSYTYCRPIVIDHTKVSNTDQTNFPVLISGTYAYLANTANGGSVQNTNGYDIVFTADAAGISLLNYEREKYVSATGEAEFWVRIPTLSHTADTTIYMWYGKSGTTADPATPSLVWDSNFKGVWHLANGSTLSATDSTGNAHNGTVYGATATTGQIDGGANFVPSSSQYVDMGNVLNIGATDFSISYWIDNPATSQVVVAVAKRTCGSWPYCMYLTGQGYLDGGGGWHAGQGIFFFGIGTTNIFQSYHTTNNVVDGNWHYVTVTRTSGVIAIYIDGVSAALTIDAASTASVDFTNQADFEIGFDNGSEYENGKLDEVRISTTYARPADWIATEYHNQSSPSTFYTIGSATSQGTVATPTFSVAAGTYTTSQTVAISTSTTGATIRYTTNGTTPSETSGTVYSGAITVSTSQTLKAIAYKAGWSDSSVGTAAYTITGQVATPTFSPGTGAYTTTQSVVISSSTTGAIIRYTTNGTTPSETSGTVYSGAISVSSSQTLNAIAYETGWIDSNVATAVYTIVGTVAAPTFSPAAGTYSSTQSVAISTTTSGATIRYTINGTTPSETNGTVYNGAISIASTTTVKAIAYLSGWTDSAVATALYTISTSGSNGYAQHRTVTIDHTKVLNTDQSNFPVLVSGFYNYLSTTTYGGKVQNANGYDIIFTSDAAGSTTLSFEREKYVASTGEVAFWVKVPTLSHTADTTIYMWYGNSAVSTDQATPSQVWDSSYLGVWHMADNAANTTVSDSTGHGYALTAPANTSTMTSSGVVDGALSLTNSQQMQHAYSATLNPSQFTVEGWVKDSVTYNTRHFIGAMTFSPTVVGYQLDLDGSASQVIAFAWGSGGGCCNGISYGADAGNTWYHLVGTYDGTAGHLYINGAKVGDSTAPYTPSQTAPLSIGDGNDFAGTFDEVRLSNTARSSDWIATEYNNEISPSTFYTIGVERNPASQYITSLTPNYGPVGTSVTIAGTGFGTSQGTSTVTFNGTTATASSWGANSITVTVPSGATTGNVVVTFGGLASVGVAFSVTGQGGMSAYAHHRAITINHARVPNTDQSSFPLLISGVYSYLATITNGGHVQNANGYDISFTSDAAGTSPLSLEREKYVALTGEVAFWVKIPTLSHTADTTIYVWYGNTAISTDQTTPSQVWDSNYLGVWHLTNGTTLSAADSTGNGYNGTVLDATAGTGIIDGGANSNGSTANSGNTIDIPSLAAALNGNQVSIEYWYNGGYYGPGVIVGNDGPYFSGKGVTVSYAGSEIGMDLSTGNGQRVTASTSDSTGQWHFIAGTYNGSSASIYHDGTSVGSITASGNLNVSTSDVYLGQAWYGYSYVGTLDEVRISRVARSADWIATEYNNQSSPATFYTIGLGN